MGRPAGWGAAAYAHTVRLRHTFPEWTYSAGRMTRSGYWSGNYFSIWPRRASSSSTIGRPIHLPSAWRDPRTLTTWSISPVTGMFTAAISCPANYHQILTLFLFGRPALISSTTSLLWRRQSPPIWAQPNKRVKLPARPSRGRIAFVRPYASSVDRLIYCAPGWAGRRSLRASR